jgi:dihydroxy-acid dehydratase
VLSIARDTSVTQSKTPSRTSANAAMGISSERTVSPALRAYAAMATSADTGAVRDVAAIERAISAGPASGQHTPVA